MIQTWASTKLEIKPLWDIITSPVFHNDAMEPQRNEISHPKPHDS